MDVDSSNEFMSFLRNRDDTKNRCVSLPGHRRTLASSPGLGATRVPSIWQRCWWLQGLRCSYPGVPRAVKGVCPFPGECWVIAASHIGNRSLTRQNALLLPKQQQSGKKPARFLMQGNELFHGTYSAVYSETENPLISKGLKKKKRPLLKWLGVILSRNLIILATSWTFLTFNVLYMEIGFSNNLTNQCWQTLILSYTVFNHITCFPHVSCWCACFIYKLNR